MHYMYAAPGLPQRGRDMPHPKRAHFGLTPTKFFFSAQDISVTLGRVGFEGNLVIALKRGSHHRETEPLPLQEKIASDGSLVRFASTPQDLALMVTMFKRKDGSFEKKEAAFTLVEEGRNGSERKIGTARFDLSPLTQATSVPQPLDLDFGEGNGKATLRCVVNARMLHRMAGRDDSSEDAQSVASSASVRSASGAGPSTDRPSLSSLPNVPAGSTSEPGTSAGADTSPWGAVASPADGGRSSGTSAQLASLREELRRATEEYEEGARFARRLKEEVDALGKRQRELRREQTTRRDDVVLQLEVALERKVAENMSAEESLSNAFNGVVKDLNERIDALVAERDKLLIAQETRGKRGF